MRLAETPTNCCFAPSQDHLPFSVCCWAADYIAAKKLWQDQFLKFADFATFFFLAAAFDTHRVTIQFLSFKSRRVAHRSLEESCSTDKVLSPLSKKWSYGYYFWYCEYKKEKNLFCKSFCIIVFFSLCRGYVCDTRESELFDYWKVLMIFSLASSFINPFSSSL